jgi:hypothetical protein
MAIGVVGPNPTVRPPAPAGGAVAVPGTATTPYAYGQDAYAPAAAPTAYAPAAAPTAYTTPAYGATAAPGAQAAGFNIGRVASWGAGALAAARFILPHLSGGWLKIAVVGAGALVGNFAWNRLEKDVAPAKAGGVGHVGTIAGGAVGGFLLGRSILGDNPAGWLIGGIAAAGAFVGHKLYAAMNKA